MSKVAYSLEQQKEFLEELNVAYGKDILTNKEILSFVQKKKLAYPNFLFNDQTRKVAWGKYSIAMAPLTAIATPAKNAIQMTKTPTVVPFVPKNMQADLSATVPDKDPTYVPFGNYSDIEKIISSKIFFPVYVTGLSGNGKTMSIAQACAKLKRELVRINVTEETDELDLLGGTELVDGSTVNREGAVLLAMRRGAVLLIDEGDLNNGKILCLMPILEGKAYLNKKTGEVIHPAPGFNVFITGNTKGKGSEDGRFVGTKVMNEAFLERFAITMEQEYPTPAIEKKIVLKNMELVGTSDDDFATKLCTWSEIIRKSFFEGAVDEIITTRRLVHIVKTQAIFKDRLKSINLALNRFDTETKNSFLDLYTKVDATVVAPANAPVDAPVSYASDVKLSNDPYTNDVIVESHGRRSVISQTEILQSNLSQQQMIDSIVTQHASNPINPVADDTAPF